MRPIGFGRSSNGAADESPAPLGPRDLARLSLGWSSSFTMRELEQHLLTYPNLSWWIPSSGEYLIGGPWRHRNEIAVIEGYLPEKLGEAEILAAIDAAIGQTGASGPADMGKLMGVLKPALAGQADMGQVSALVKKKLAG